MPPRAATNAIRLRARRAIDALGDGVAAELLAEHCPLGWVRLAVREDRLEIVGSVATRLSARGGWPARLLELRAAPRTGPGRTLYATLYLHPDTGQWACSADS